MRKSIIFINEWNQENNDLINKLIQEGYSGLIKNIRDELITEMMGLSENISQQQMEQQQETQSEEIIEVKFIENANSFQEISNNLKVKVLVSNEERLKFYQKYQFDVEITNKITDYINDYEVIIVEQQQISNIELDKKLDIYVLFQQYPLSLNEYEQKCLEYNNHISNKIKDIIPIQTHNYKQYQANINNDNVKLTFYIHWNNHVNRIDKLQNLDESIKKPQFISGKIINSQGFWRQLLFSHSKLPKYGA